jgi:hypothetical protein
MQVPAALTILNCVLHTLHQPTLLYLIPGRGSHGTRMNRLGSFDILVVLLPTVRLPSRLPEWEPPRILRGEACPPQAGPAVRPCTT